MGEVKHLKCTNCGREWDISVGAGRMHGKKESVVTCFSPRLQSRVEQAIRNEAHPPFGFAMAIGSCRSCKEFVSVPTIRSGAERIADSCPNCSGEVEAAFDPAESLSCPACGGKAEVSKTPLLWD